MFPFLFTFVMNEVMKDDLVCGYYGAEISNLERLCELNYEDDLAWYLEPLNHPQVF